LTITLSILSLLLFGTTFESALNKKENTVWLLAKYFTDFCYDTIMHYQCTGHRLWFFLSFICMPSLNSLVKVVTN